jgi:hypothetical protein
MGKGYMKKFENWIWVVALVGPSLVMAQPPEEELSPTAPEFNIEVMDAPAPAEPVAPAAAAPAAPATIPAAPTANAQTIQPILPAIPAKMPVAEAAAPAAPKEDKSVKGISLTPGFTLIPIGYSGVSKQTYTEFNPTVTLETVFKTSNGRDVTLNFNYSFAWDENFNKREDAGVRSFDHKLISSAGIAWTDALTMKLSTEFDYTLTASTDRGQALYTNNLLAGALKINPEVTVQPGYHLFYLNNLDSNIYLSDGILPNDSDEVRQGNSAIGGYDPFGGDPFSTQPAYDPSVGSKWLATNAAQLKTTYKPVKETAIEISYEYQFVTFTNAEDQAWKGHIASLKITQDLPWKGGKVWTSDEIRLRGYDTKVNTDDTSYFDVRNRFRFDVSQEITSSISAEMFYQWDMTTNNADLYVTKVNQNSIWASIGYSF